MSEGGVERVSMETPGMAEEQRARLRELFPEVFVEGEIDWDRLRATLGEVAEGPDRYQFTWAGKRDAIRLLQLPTTKTLVPDREASVNWDETKHVFIEGENLDVLKLLYKPYFGRVKMIYIDPPYNTGGDFIYPDNFAVSLDEHLRATGQKDENGNYQSSEDVWGEGRNSAASGRYHSAWLSMMYPRLFLARQLLRDDGVIFVSIDDNEVHNLRMVMNEIFGEENFVACVTWHRKRGKDNSASFFSKVHDFILVFAKNIASLKWYRLALDDTTKRAYKNPLKDKRGPYRTLGLWSRGGQGGSRYAYSMSDGSHFGERDWLVGEETMRQYEKEDRLIKVGDKLYRKLFLYENEGAIPDTIWVDASNNANAADELKAIFGGLTPFSTPKPVPLIRRMIQLATAGDDIVLDFFAGSCTTAEAVIAQNEEDNGRRTFIMVQLPEPLVEGSPGYEQGYRNIAEIGRDRIRKVIASRTGLTGFGMPTTGDVNHGFKAFSLADSTLNQWTPFEVASPDTYIQQLEFFAEPLSSNAKEMILYELALREGFTLNCKVDRLEAVSEHETFRISENEKVVYVCLSASVDSDIIKYLDLTGEALLVCFDDALTDTTMANLALQVALKTI